MKITVNPHSVQIIRTPINEKEINVTACEFEFNEEIPEGFVKEAYFTFEDETYKQIITNNQCQIPAEVLEKAGTIKLGVVAYSIDPETEEITRYNPTPAYLTTWSGSLTEAENSQPITPSEMEQYEQALQDGLTEVNSKINDIDEAITETNNLNIDASKSGSTATITIVKKDGTNKQVQVLDGAPGTPGSNGTTPTIGNNGNWYIGATDTGKPSRGATGQTGPAGQDGISPTANVTKEGSTATITITDKNGTTTTTISDGQMQDLSNYYTKEETNQAIASAITTTLGGSY